MPSSLSTPSLPSALLPVVCGADVHLASITVTILWAPDADGVEPPRLSRKFATDTASLETFAAWLREHQCFQVVLESTGVYWKPVFTILEEHGIGVCLANAQQVKAIPGRKTDLKDSEWLALLALRGLVRPSLIPDAAFRACRDLLRRRKKLVRERNAETNRLYKVLAEANIPVRTVISKLDGVSAEAILRALVNGERDPEQLAKLARGKLARKRAALKRVLYGRIQPHHVILLQQGLAHRDFLSQQIALLEAELDQRLAEVHELVTRLDTIPGVDHFTAQAILVELGGDISAFPDGAHLASWAGLCPGNHVSAGKRRKGKNPRGNRWLKEVLVEAGWAASHTKGTFLRARFDRVMARRGLKRAVMAIAHRIGLIAYHILATDQEYHELGADYYRRHQNPSRVKERCLTALKELGYTVTLTRQEAPATS